MSAKNPTKREAIRDEMVLLMDQTEGSQLDKLDEAKREAWARKEGYYDNWCRLARETESAAKRAKVEPITLFDQLYNEAKTAFSGKVHSSAATVVSVLKKALRDGVSLYAKGKQPASYGLIRARANAASAKDNTVTVDQVNACTETKEVQSLRKAKSEGKNNTGPAVGEEERNVPRMPESVGERILQLKRKVAGMSEQDAIAYLDKMLADEASGGLPETPAKRKARGRATAQLPEPEEAGTPLPELDAQIGL